MNTTDAMTAAFILLAKSKLVSGRINSNMVYPRVRQWRVFFFCPELDAQLLDLPGPGVVIEDDPRDENGREHADDEADRQGHGEPLHRPRPELEEKYRRDERRHVRVEDGQEGFRVARVDGGARRLARPQFLPGALEYEHVGIHGHTDGEHDACDTRHRERGVEERHRPEQQD